MSTKANAPTHDTYGQPFDTAQDAWFWFIQAYAARAEGARITAGQGMTMRPCEPMDILSVLDRLWRSRMLLRDHILVLRHYGNKLCPPDPWRRKEARAAVLWQQALERIEPVLIRKGIVAAPQAERMFA